MYIRFSLHGLLPMEIDARAFATLADSTTFLDVNVCLSCL